MNRSLTIRSNKTAIAVQAERVGNGGRGLAIHGRPNAVMPSQQRWVSLPSNDRTFYAPPRLRHEFGLDRPYQQHAWTYAIIRALASNIAQIPLVTMMGDFSTRQGTPVLPGQMGYQFQEMFDSPNGSTTTTELKEAVVDWLSLSGECLLIKVGADPDRPIEPYEMPTQLYPFSGREFDHIMDPQRRQIVGYLHRQPGKRDADAYLAHEICQVKYYNPYYPLRGLAPHEAARQVTQSDWKQSQYNEAFFDNDATPGVILVSQTELGPAQKDELRESWDERNRGYRRRRRTTVLEGGMDIKDVGSTHRDMEFVNLARYNVEQLCAVYKVPDAEISNYKNLNFATAEAIKTQFWNNTLLPIMTLIEEAIYNGMMKRPGRTRYWVEFDRAKIDALVENELTKMNTGQVAMDMGVPFNEVNERYQLGFKKQPGWGDVGSFKMPRTPAKSLTEAPAPIGGQPGLPGAPMTPRPGFPPKAPGDSPRPAAPEGPKPGGKSPGSQGDPFQPAGSDVPSVSADPEITRAEEDAEEARSVPLIVVDAEVMADEDIPEEDRIVGDPDGVYCRSVPDCGHEQCVANYDALTARQEAEDVQAKIDILDTPEKIRVAQAFLEIDDRQREEAAQEEWLDTREGPKTTTWEKIKNQILSPHEKKFHKRYGNYLHQLRKHQLQKLEASKLGRMAIENDGRPMDFRDIEALVAYRDAVDDAVFEQKPWDSKLKEMHRPLYMAIMMDSAKGAQDELGSAPGVGFDLGGQAMLDALHKREQILVGTNSTLRSNIYRELERGVRAGEAPRQLAERIKSVFNTSNAQALRIARTETAGMTNMTRNEVQKQEGLESTEWLTARDERVRPTHRLQDGEIRPLGAEFPNGCLYPGDPEGDASETINCRCVAIPVLKTKWAPNSVQGIRVLDAAKEQKRMELEFQQKDQMLRDQREHELAVAKASAPVVTLKIDPTTINVAPAKVDVAAPPPAQVNVKVEPAQVKVEAAPAPNVVVNHQHHEHVRVEGAKVTHNTPIEVKPAINAGDVHVNVDAQIKGGDKKIIVHRDNVGRIDNADVIAELPGTP